MKYELHPALAEMRPGARFRILGGVTYAQLVWDDESQTVPTEDEVNAWIQNKNSVEPMRLLRLQRDALLRNVDWRVSRAYSTGVPLSPEWAEYMQALRDLPDNATPQLNSNGKLDMASVNWPVPPL